MSRGAESGAFGHSRHAMVSYFNLFESSRCYVRKHHGPGTAFTRFAWSVPPDEFFSAGDLSESLTFLQCIEFSNSLRWDMLDLR